MERDNFQKAELIELHDARVRIHPERYSDAIMGWSWDDIDSGVDHIVIDGDSLSDLAKFFGVNPRYQMSYSNKDRPYKRVLENMEFPIASRQWMDVGYSTSQHRIRELWARVESPHLLSIRMINLYRFVDMDSNDEQKDEEKEITVNLTYCGNFTVWWS